MAALWVAFITGINHRRLELHGSTGRVAGKFAGKPDRKRSVHPTKKHKKRSPQNCAAHPAVPCGKTCCVYNLGLLLGGIGSFFQFTPTMQAILQFIIAIFMIGNALRMLNVHPFFKIFSFEPPASVTRFIRRKAKNSTSLGDSHVPRIFNRVDSLRCDANDDGGCHRHRKTSPWCRLDVRFCFGNLTGILSAFLLCHQAWGFA